jgi:hypothetical protein
MLTERKKENKNMLEPINVKSEDIDLLLHRHAGNCIFADSLARIADNEELSCALGRYVHFNSVFGGGVANLAGEVAARQDLFRDPDETVDVLADRSVEVAAEIFFAAVDEFGAGANVRRATHRTLAQATFKGVGRFFDLTPAELEDIVTSSEATLSAISKVRDGYSLNQTASEEKLFRAIGFHIGSEALADQEFNILDEFLKRKYPVLVEFLKKTRVPITGIEQPAYRWIEIHTTVEADHFNAAIHSANLALRYYAGSETQACVKSWILKGFSDFAMVQTEFMEGLAAGKRSNGFRVANQKNESEYAAF